MRTKQVIIFHISLFCLCSLVYGGTNSAFSSDTLRINHYLQRLDSLDNTIYANKKLALLNKIKRVSLLVGYKKGIFRSEFYRAKVYNLNENPDSALILSKNLQIGFNDLTALDSAELLSLIGSSYLKKRILDSAIQYINRSFEFYKNSPKSDIGFSKSYGNLSICFYQLGQNKKALMYQKEALNYALKTKDLDLISNAINNCSVLISQSGKYEEGMKLFNTLYKDAKFVNKPNLKSTVLYNLGMLHRELNNLDSAKFYYKKGLEMKRKFQLSDSANSLLALGVNAAEQNLYTESIGYFNKALNSSASKKDTGAIYKALSHAFYKVKNHDQSNYYWMLYSKFIESSHKNRTARLLAQSSNKIELYRKDLEILSLEKEKEVLSLIKERSNLITISLSLLLSLVVLVFIFYLKKRQMEKERKIKELKKKNQELLELTLRISKKNEILKEIDTILSSRKSNDSNSNVSLHAEMKKIVRKNSSMEKDWKSLEVYFRDIHKGFYRNLKEAFPELTDNDLRICSLVSLKLSLKEISDILFISSDSVKSARYRIRKKMNLEKEANLSEFLENYK